VLIAIDQILKLAEKGFRRVEELVTAKQIKGEKIETDRPIFDYVSDEFRANARLEWRRLEQQVGKKA
jgi:hypothetical protein